MWAYTPVRAAGRLWFWLTGRREKKGSEVFIQPVPDTGKKTTGFLGGFGLDRVVPVDCPALYRFTLEGDVLQGSLGFAAVRFKTPGKPDLVSPFVLPDPGRCIHISTIFCFLDRVRVILGEMDLTHESD